MSLRTWAGRSGSGGFTLVEMLVVVAIIGMLVGVATVTVLKYLDRARADTARLEIANMKTAVQKYAMDIGAPPSQQEGLNVLLEKPADDAKARRWDGPYLDVEEIPVDPWGNAYIYFSPGEGNAAFEIISLGKDGTQGGEGSNADISSRRLAK